MKDRKSIQEQLAYYRKLREQYIKMRDEENTLNSQEGMNDSLSNENANVMEKGRVKTLSLPGMSRMLPEDNQKNNAAFTQVFTLCLLTFVFEVLFLVASYFIFS